MKELRRIQVGEFNIEKAVTIDELRKDESLLSKNLITIEEIFKNKNRINLRDNKMKPFLNGIELNIKEKDDTYLIYNNKKFIGLGIVKDNLLKRDVVI